ncbi:MAG: GGDEF domain-containing protein [Sandaracinus sp.]|nr:GGDEF domain-containing protein [Sandaracinus sp.]MCB9630701.1 GGDEF domain-containing protein [Sandaracinus sp.]
MPYAPFVGASPVVDGRLQSGWFFSVGGPSLFAGAAVLFIFTAILRRLRVRQAELERLGRTDALTGLANRVVFFERLAAEVERAQRHTLPLSVLVIDVDHFKAVNDRHGHLAGDAALRALAARLAREGRASDLLARYGGEELTMVLPHTDTEGAKVVAERLRRAAHEIHVGERPLTVSIGVAQRRDSESHDALLGRADDALYDAKRAGRDRVVVGR